MGLGLTILLGLGVGLPLLSCPNVLVVLPSSSSFGMCCRSFPPHRGAASPKKKKKQHHPTGGGKGKQPHPEEEEEGRPLHITLRYFTLRFLYFALLFFSQKYVSFHELKRRASPQPREGGEQHHTKAEVGEAAPPKRSKGNHHFTLSYFASLDFTLLQFKKCSSISILFFFFKKKKRHLHPQGRRSITRRRRRKAAPPRRNGKRHHPQGGKEASPGRSKSRGTTTLLDLTLLHLSVLLFDVI